MTPAYCSMMTEIDGIPNQGQMELFKPYFEANQNNTALIVKFKVPSNCFHIISNSATPPSEGSCGNGNELNHCIVIEEDFGCTDSTETICTITLNYVESQSGEKLIIYIMGNGGGRPKGISKSKMAYF